jgi:dTDP-4-dehydrorhamnose 3,5-epimerase
LRLGSPTFLNVEYVELFEESGQVVYIPSGVGHAFLTLSDEASVVYLTSSGYAPQFEKGISPLDPEIGLAWSISEVDLPILSKNDMEAPTLAKAKEDGTLPIFKLS